MGVLLPAQDHFANRIAIQLAPSLTNTFGGRMHVGEKYRPIKSDGAEEGLTDLLHIHNRFSHITLLLIALWQPLH